MNAVLPILQRTTGAAQVAFGPRGLSRLRQQGSAKAILPHVGAAAEVVFLNTAGGLTAGDRLSYATEVPAGLRLTATTQTAERAYRADGGVACVRVTHRVDGWLDWLPQETILFQGAALSRRTRVDLGPGAGCLLLEAAVLGRAAMGEVVRAVRFADRREVWQGGRPRLVEPLRIDDAGLLSGLAGLNGARAFASMAMVMQGAEDAVGPVRAVLGPDAAVSGFDGKLIVRMMAADGWPLRQQIVAALGVLRRAPLPRVWQM
jgi:urease accessory protein